MRQSTMFFLASLWAAPWGAPAAVAQTIELKDGGRIAVDPGGRTSHTDARGKRLRIRNGAVMEAKDGHRYVMRNDALWRQGHV
jgi:hypothetical protein